MTAGPERKDEEGEICSMRNNISAEELQDDPITRGLQLEIKSKFCF